MVNTTILLKTVIMNNVFHRFVVKAVLLKSFKTQQKYILKIDINRVVMHTLSPLHFVLAYAFCSSHFAAPHTTLCQNSKVLPGSKRLLTHCLLHLTILSLMSPTRNTWETRIQLPYQLWKLTGWPWVGHTLLAKPIPQGWFEDTVEKRNGDKMKEKRTL